MSLSSVVKGTVIQKFGPSKLAAEPRMYGDRDSAGWKRCKPSAFAGYDGVWNDFHPGVDIACPVGTAVRAPADGTVVRCNTYRVWNPFVNAYVYARDVWFRFGTRMLYVAHLSKFSVKEGTHVTKGTVIARTGNSGISTGPHAHLERMVTTNAYAYGTAMRENPERYF